MTSMAPLNFAGLTGNSRWSLAGMTALVTGGTHGIGYAVVEELATLGAVVHTCSRNEAELNQRLQEWFVKGFNVTGSVCDVSSRPKREQLIEKVSSLFSGKLNILLSKSAMRLLVGLICFYTVKKPPKLPSIHYNNDQSEEQIQVMSSNPVSCDGEPGLVIPVYLMIFVLVFVMWVMVAVIPCQERTMLGWYTGDVGGGSSDGGRDCSCGGGAT
ncbi:hypothetical protein L6452_05477 [Arctium lappa]|uniref:Uncharacterized protein n=1 Tax=Arctium lappa TaxID=4217 RepID=A0ACB9EH79_ARCLA|nr:hypothetical protein L6452_05477 [Arctium lappa]